MNALVLTCLGGVALAVVTYESPPEASRTPGRDVFDHSSIAWNLPPEYRSPNLRAEVDMNCSDLPLRDLLSGLAKQARATVFFDERKIANTKAALAEPMDIKIDQKITLYSALALALEDRELAYYIKDGEIVITNKSFVVSPRGVRNRPDK